MRRIRLLLRGDRYLCWPCWCWRCIHCWNSAAQGSLAGSNHLLAVLLAVPGTQSKPAAALSGIVIKLAFGSLQPELGCLDLDCLMW